MLYKKKINMNFNLVEMYNGLLRFNKHILNELAEGLLDTTPTTVYYNNIRRIYTKNRKENIKPQT